MAIYHCSIKIGSRGGGRSAAAASAYRAADKVQDRETGMEHDFTRKSGVVHDEIMLCQNAPEEYMNRETLWNSAQAAERAKNGQLFREVEVALPTEMTREQQIEAVREYCRENFVEKGMCVDFAIHDKNDGNPHAHILCTMRGINESGKWEPKRRTEYARDENGEKIPELDKNGKQKIGKNGRKMWQRIDRETNDWNSQENAEKWREAWARTCNQYLDQEHRIDHRSFERRGIDRIPTKHEGFAARQMERRGGIASSCELNREIRRINAARHQLEVEQRGIIIDLAKARHERALRQMRDELKQIRNYIGGNHNAVAKGEIETGRGTTGRADERRRATNTLRRAGKSNLGHFGRNQGRDFTSFEQRRNMQEVSFFGVDSEKARAGLLLSDLERSGMEIQQPGRMRDNNLQRPDAGGADAERAKRLRQKDAIARRKHAEKFAAEKSELASQQTRISAIDDKISGIKAKKEAAAYRQNLNKTVEAVKMGVSVSDAAIKKILPKDLGEVYGAAKSILVDSIMNPSNLLPHNAIKNAFSAIAKCAAAGQKDAQMLLRNAGGDWGKKLGNWEDMGVMEKDELIHKALFVDDYGVESATDKFFKFNPKKSVSIPAPDDDKGKGFARVRTK